MKFLSFSGLGGLHEHMSIRLPSGKFKHWCRTTVNKHNCCMKFGMNLTWHGFVEEIILEFLLQDHEHGHMQHGVPCVGGSRIPPWHQPKRYQQPRISVLEFCVQAAEESWGQVWWIWLCWVIGRVTCRLKKSMTRAKREPLKWSFCSFLQKSGVFHSGRHLETLFCSSCFSIEKTWTVTIFKHFSLSEIILWQLAQARCYQPASLFEGFHH